MTWNLYEEGICPHTHLLTLSEGALIRNTVLKEIIAIVGWTRVFYVQVEYSLSGIPGTRKVLNFGFY